METICGSVIRDNQSFYEKANNIVKTISDEMNKGNEVSMYIAQVKETYSYTDNGWTISQANPIRFYNAENLNTNIYQNPLICDTFSWNEGGAHAVKVTGLTNDGVVVSTWGYRALIPYQDLVDSHAYNITSTEFGTPFKIVKSKLLQRLNLK